VLADGGDIAGARALVSLRSGEASSRWGKFDHLEISSSIAPAETNRAIRGSFLSTLSAFRTDFGSLGSLRIEGDTLWSRNMDLLLTNSVRVSAENIDSKWFRSAQAEATVASIQLSTNGPIRSTISLNTDAIEAPGLAARTNAIHVDFEHPCPLRRRPHGWPIFFRGRLSLLLRPQMANCSQEPGRQIHRE
jgi:hypothetical protein